MATKDISDKLVCAAYNQYMKASRKAVANADIQALSNTITPLEYLKDKTKEPTKVCWRAMERAFKRGLTGFGVGLNYGWLTVKGKELLQQGESNDNIQAG